MPRASQKRKDSAPSTRAKVRRAPRAGSASVDRAAKSSVPARQWRNRIVGSGEEDPEQLLANPKNWRVHPKAQQDALEGVLKEVGWVQQVIVNQRTGYVVDGHARVAMAISRGEKVPVVYVDLDEHEEALILATLDPLSAMAGTDDDLFRSLVSDLSVSDVAVKALIDSMSPPVTKAGLTEDDAVPDTPELATTVLGDLWLLGLHRVLCGDSTSIDAVERLMGGQKADMVFTDPPYGVDFERGKYVGREKAAKGPVFAPIANDELKGQDLERFMQEAFTCAYVASKDCAIYAWTGCSPKLAEGGAVTLRALQSAGWTVQSQIIWKKTPFVMGRCDYHWQHEACWYGYKGKNHAWYGGRDKGSVWDVPKPQKMDLHPTMKPVQLAETAIDNSSKGGDAILDLFGGSGSTLIASEKTGRDARLMELDPKYVDVIVKRWQDYTGQEATLEGDGRTFNQIASERFGIRLGAQDAIKEEVCEAVQ